MLQNAPEGNVPHHPGRYAIVASLYNPRYVDSMLHAASVYLEQSGAVDVQVVRVPGAFEIPVAAAHLARSNKGFEAVLCFGVILRGATTHAQHIGEAVTNALMQLQVETGIPMVHEVLLLENETQAQERCIDPKRNRGLEAAGTAVQMAITIRHLHTM
jgi:6,7-dimethyl-8-ribityllumazine synthase